MTFFVFSVLPAPDSPLIQRYSYQQYHGKNNHYFFNNFLIPLAVYTCVLFMCGCVCVGLFFKQYLRNQHGLIFSICVFRLKKRKKKQSNQFAIFFELIKFSYLSLTYIIKRFSLSNSLLFCLFLDLSPIIILE